MTDFKSSKYYYAIYSIPFVLTEYDGGKLISHSFKDACKKWWNGISEENKLIIMGMPNFDNDILEEITGIKL